MAEIKQQPQDLESLKSLATILFKSGIFQSIRSTEQAIVKILAGAELGFSPMASLSGVHFIEGKPSIGAHLMAASIKKSPDHDYEVIDLNKDRCEIAFSSHGKRLGMVIVTMQEVKDAKLDRNRDGSLKANWARHPDDMLFARAISKGFRRFCPDLTGGMSVYVPDEMDEDQQHLVHVKEQPKAIEAETVDRHELMDEIDKHQLRLKIGAEPFKARLRQKYGTDTASDLTDEQLQEMAGKLAAAPDPQPKEEG